MSLKVYCRIRPPSSSALNVRNNTISLKSHSFDFDYVFSDNSSQKDIFDQTAAELIMPSIQGQNGCVILFGPTE